MLGLWRRHWCRVEERVSLVNPVLDAVGDFAAEHVGAEYPVTSRDLGIFVDQAAESVAPQDPGGRAHSGRMLTLIWRSLAQRPVRPVRIEVLDVLAQDQAQVPLAGDQHPVQALTACAGNPAFRDRVRTRRLHRRLDDPHADRGEDRVERRGELGIPVADDET